MSSNTIEDLRRRLFETIDGVRAGTTTVDQAKTISELSQVIVNSAKVEVEYLRAKDGRSAFIPEAPDEEQQQHELPNGVVRVVQHRIKG